MPDDLCAVPVQADVAAQVVIHVLVRERTQQNDEQERGPQQFGAEDRGPLKEVKGLQLRGERLDPRSLIPSARDVKPPSRSTILRVVVVAQRISHVRNDITFAARRATDVIPSR
jgi:hypothetical protein